MPVGPEKLSAFHAYCLIAESRAFGGATDYSDVLGHGPILQRRLGFHNGGVDIGPATPAIDKVPQLYEEC
jgi:hypothetical protein